MPQSHSSNNFALVIVALLVTASSFAQQTRPNSWNFSLGLRETRALDVIRNGEPAPDEIIDSVTAAFGFSAIRERSSMNLGARIGGNRRQDQDNRSQLTYGGQFAWNYRSSARSSMAFTTGVSKNFRLDTLTDLGVLPGDLSTLSTTTNWSFQHRAAERTNWSVGILHQYYDFGSTSNIPSSQVVLNDQPFGDEFAVTTPETASPADLIAPDGENDVLRILATEGLRGGSTKSHRAGLNFGMSHQLGERTSITGSLVGSYQTLERSFTQSGPRGGAQLALTQRIKRSHSLSATYNFQRSFIEEPGITVQSLSAGWGYSPDGSSVSVSLSAGASQFRQVDDPGEFFPIASASFSWAPSADGTFGLSYRRQFSVPMGFGRSRLIDYGNANYTYRFGDRVTFGVFLGVTFAQDPTAVGTEWDARRAGANFNFRVVSALNAGVSFSYNETNTQDLLRDESLRRRVLSFNLNYAPNW